MGYRPAYNEIFDHVLLMGPLYHLLEAHERETAMCAALSRLKPGGTIAVSFIGSYSDARSSGSHFKSQRAGIL